MAVQNFTPSPTEVDLEATAELPAMDFAGTATDIASTDVHIAPGIPAGVAELASSLREAEQRLARKMERVAGLEGDLASALRTAVELRAQLDIESAQSAPRETALREAELQLARKTERVTGLETDLANAQRTAVELRTQLDQESVQTTRRENTLRENDQQLTRRSERITVLESELATAQRNAAELRTQLDHESTQGAAHEKALREAELQLARRTERVAGLETELANSQRNAAELRTQLDHESAQGARHEKALHEAEQKLSQKTERVVALETELANEQRAVAEQRAALDQERLQGAQRERALRERGLAFEQQLSGLRQELAAREASNKQQATDLLELRRRNERSIEALQTWQGFRGVAAAQLNEHDALLVQVEAQHAAQLAAIEARTAELQMESAAARLAATHRVTALEESLRQAQNLRQEHEAAMQLQKQLGETLQAQLALATAKTSKVEEHLHVAEEHIHRLESEAHASATLLGNLQQNVERLGRDDTGSRPVLRVVATEPVQRVLIRQVDGVDIEYPLGKRTTIGRTPDNDIQIDTTFISRHHAVVLSNPDQCVVEDLNSTNGVMINGRSVNRQALRDGDLLTVGKSEFRYQQRA